MGEIILTLSIHQLRNSQHVINLALTPCSSGVTFKIQYSVVQSFPPPLPATVRLSLNCLLNKFSVIGLQGTLGDLWHIVELLHLNPISLFFFPPLPFCLVELSGNCWSQNNSICREGCFGVCAFIVNYIMLLTTLLSIR